MIMIQSLRLKNRNQFFNMKKKIIDNFNNFQAKTTPNPLKIVVKNATGSYITDFDNK